MKNNYIDVPAHFLIGDDRFLKDGFETRPVWLGQWHEETVSYRADFKAKAAPVSFLSVQLPKWVKPDLDAVPNRSAVNRNKDIYVVVQFYSWFNFYFPLFYTHYHALPYTKTKESEPRIKLNHHIQGTDWNSSPLWCDKLLHWLSDWWRIGYSLNATN